MELGPVELVVLTFPGERADPDVVAAVAKVVSQGYVTVLDLVFISRLQTGRSASPTSTRISTTSGSGHWRLRPRPS